MTCRNDAVRGELQTSAVHDEKSKMALDYFDDDLCNDSI